MKLIKTINSGGFSFAKAWKDFQRKLITKAIKEYDSEKHWKRRGGFHLSEELMLVVTRERENLRVPFPGNRRRMFIDSLSLETEPDKTS